ncbi:MAG TPA: DPP IV N-terminal domain-containing protein [Candidatus Dormibacteraeota bacterium]|nr:DPP IV N-terminal domain-containing protein [Candidatus Dormibacteraeota bacterium]
MSRRGGILLAVLAAVQIQACGAPQPAACGAGGEQPHPEVGGQLVFVCYAPQNHGNLYLLDVATGHVRDLTPDGAWNVDPSWSPDGTRIAFQSTRDGRDNVYVMNVQSGVVTRLTDGRGFNGFPTWSPDGRYIAYESSRDGITSTPDPPGYYRTIYVIGADGSGLHRLLRATAVDSGPAWSPSGDLIAFSSDRERAYDIYVVGLDGADPRQLTHHAMDGGFGTYPRWSPDGTRLAFNDANSAGTGSEVYVVMLDGSAPVQITNDPHSIWEAWPDWSPDSRWIAFARAGEGQQLFAVHPDGTGQVQLTTSAGDKILPRWRPSP